METNPTETACPPGTNYAPWAEAKNRDFSNGIHHRVITDLAPHFDKDPVNLPLAMGMAMRAVMSLLPEEEADWFNAGDIVSLSLTSLDLLKDAATLDMPPALKLRFVGRAIQASKEAREVEATLQKRRKEREAMHPERVRRIRDPLGYNNTQPQPQPAATAVHAAFAGMAADIERMMREAEHAAQSDAPDPEVLHAEAPAEAGCAPSACQTAATADLEPLPEAPEPVHLPPSPNPREGHPLGVQPAANGQQSTPPRTYLSSTTSPAAAALASIDELSAIAPWLTAKGPDGEPVNAGDYLVAELKRQMQLIPPLRPQKSIHSGGKRRTG